MNKEEIDLAYLAGYFDADGCIAFVRRGKKSKSEAHRRANSFYYSARLQVGTTDINVLFTFCRYFGGSITKVKETGMPNNFGGTITKPVVMWSLGGNKQVAAVLRRLLPYLDGKKSQARFLLRYLRECRLTTSPKNGVPDELEKRRFWYWRAISTLKRQMRTREKCFYKNLPIKLKQGQHR